jgi:hypothetical protein
MATVLAEFISEEQRSVVLSGKDIHKEMFPDDGAKCLSRKAVHVWVANVSLMTNRIKRRCGSFCEKSNDFCAAGSTHG